MKKKSIKKSSGNSKPPKYKYIIVVMLCVFIIILPWISRLKLLSFKGPVAEIFPVNNGVYIDFFLYYKEVFVIFFAVIVLLFFLGERIFPDHKLSYPLKDKTNRMLLWSSMIFSVGVIISFILSDYKDLSIIGSPTEGEGVFLLLSYMILFLAGVNYFSYKSSINLLRKALLILMSITVILALIEFLYKPIFEIPFFKYFLASSDYRALLTSLENKNYNDMVTLTFYNPNYFGSLCVLLSPIAITMLINAKMKSHAIFQGIISALMVFCTLASKSTAAIYIVILELFIIVIYYRKSIIKNIKYSLFYIVGVLSIFLLLNLASGGKLIKVSADVLQNKSPEIKTDKTFALENILIDGQTLKLQGKENTLVIDLLKDVGASEEVLMFFDENMSEIIPIKKGNEYSFKEEAYENINIQNMGFGILVDIGYRETMKFYVTDEGFKGVGQKGSVIDKVNRDNYYLTEFNSVATGRGYAWIYTLPILKSTLLWGKGPGTFAMHFQQNDYVGLMNTHGTTSLLIDKPHNMYLQYGVHIGVVGIIAIMLIFGSCIYQSIKIYFRKERTGDEEEALGMGIFLGILGFIIISLVNDSTVTVSPIFWILIGAEFSILFYLNSHSEKVILQKS